MTKHLEISSSEADEIELRYRELTGIRTEYLQLSDNASWNTEIVELDGLTLIWTNIQGKMRWRDTLEADSLNLALLVSGDGKVKVGGREVDRGTAYVWQPSRDIEMVMEGPICTLELCISPGLLSPLDWRDDDHHLAEVSRQTLSELIRACTMATVAEPELEMSSNRLDQRDRILEIAIEVLRPWMEHTQEPASQRGYLNYQLVRQADDQLRRLDYQSELSIDALCAHLGVSRRTLFHAFHDVLGTGPRRYLELIRLQQLRSRLKEASPTETTVTKVASDLGFPHMGRLAGAYRRQFGESPSETLRHAGN